MCKHTLGHKKRKCQKAKKHVPEKWTDWNLKKAEKIEKIEKKSGADLGRSHFMSHVFLRDMDWTPRSPKSPCLPL